MSDETGATPTTIAHLGEFVDQDVELSGWLYNSRGKGKIAFLLLRDGTGIVQCVALKKDLPEDVFAAASSVSQEASLTIRGSVRADDRAPGGYELGVKGLTVHQNPETDYPIGKQAHGPDFLLTHRHLWLRSKKQWAIIRIRHEVIRAIRDYFDSREFINVDTPMFTPAACEGTTTLFEVPYFDLGTAYLTQSGQLYNEANCMSFRNVYCFGPAFRAEKSKTRRHLTEFWMVEPEMAYATLDDVMVHAEGLVCHVVARVLENRQPELEILERDVALLERIVPPFPRVHYDDAVKMVQEDNPDFVAGDDFGAPDEASVSKRHDRPVLIHSYPKAIKAFYMEPDPDSDDKCLSVDMIAPEGYGEIIGGGERATSLEYLEKQIEAHKLPKESFEWYLDLRRFGSVPHAGFGLGLERMVSWMCGIEHIREAIPYPRMLYRIEP